MASHSFRTCTTLHALFVLLPGARSEVSKPVTIRAGLTAGAAIPPVHYGVQLANAAQIADDMASTSHNAEAGGHTSHNAEPGHTNGDSANARPGKSKGRKGLKGIVTDSGGASTYAQQESLHGHGSDSLAPPSPGILHLKRNSTASSPNQRDNDGDEHHPPESSRKVCVRCGNCAGYTTSRLDTPGYRRGDMCCDCAVYTAPCAQTQQGTGEGREGGAGGPRGCASGFAWCRCQCKQLAESRVACPMAAGTCPCGYLMADKPICR
jgi:hypothetical protein